MIDVTLACEDGNSKLVEVVTVADVDAEKRVEDSLVDMNETEFGSPLVVVVNHLEGTAYCK